VRERISSEISSHSLAVTFRSVCNLAGQSFWVQDAYLSMPADHNHLNNKTQDEVKVLHGINGSSSISNCDIDVKLSGHSPVPGLWITGLGAQYPPYIFGPEKLDQIVKKLYDVENPG
jgi:hypothetical protein